LNLHVAHDREPTPLPVLCVSSPDDDDDEVQQVPAVADVGAGVHHQTVGQDLEEGLDGEDDEEDVLHLFLRRRENTFRREPRYSFTTVEADEVELLGSVHRGLMLEDIYEVLHTKTTCQN